jgi:hypothetical protein
MKLEASGIIPGKESSSACDAVQELHVSSGGTYGSSSPSASTVLCAATASVVGTTFSTFKVKVDWLAAVRRRDRHRPALPGAIRCHPCPATPAFYQIGHGTGRSRQRYRVTARIEIAKLIIIISYPPDLRKSKKV